MVPKRGASPSDPPSFQRSSTNNGNPFAKWDWSWRCGNINTQKRKPSEVGDPSPQLSRSSWPRRNLAKNETITQRVLLRQWNQSATFSGRIWKSNLYSMSWDPISFCVGSAAISDRLWIENGVVFSPTFFGIWLLPWVASFGIHRPTLHASQGNRCAAAQNKHTCCSDADTLYFCPRSTQQSRLNLWTSSPQSSVNSLYRNVDRWDETLLSSYCKTSSYGLVGC